MMDKDGLRRDSLREGLKAKGRSRREAAARHAESEKGSRPRRTQTSLRSRRSGGNASLEAESACRLYRAMSASLIGRSGSSTFKPSTTTFQTIHHYSVDVAHGLVLLFGIGTKAVPSWDSRTRWNNLSGGLAVGVTVGPSGQTNSPHPSSREGHHSTARWSSSFFLS